MRYTRVHWIHSHRDEAVWIFEEIDDEGWEHRKVEIFPDDTMGFADRQRDSGKTGLAPVKVPPLAEISQDPEFEAKEITAEDFENIWRQATRG